MIEFIKFGVFLVLAVYVGTFVITAAVTLLAMAIGLIMELFDK